MMKRVVAFTMFLVCVALCLFTGCSGLVQPNGAKPDHGSTEAEQPVLHVLLWYQDEGRKRTFNNYISQYQDAFPNVKIEFELIVDTVELQIKTQAYSASGEIPDVVFCFYPAIIPLIEAGQLLDLGPYAENDGFIKKYQGEACIQRYSDGGLYALNSAGSDYYFAPVILYHQDIFEQHHISIPRNYAEWMAACEKLLQAGITPIALAGKDGAVPAGQFMQLFYMAEDPRVVQDLLDEKTDWNNPALISAIDKIQKMVNNGYFMQDVATSSYDEALNTFIQNEAAMIFAGGWEIPNLVEKCKDVSIMDMPSFNTDYQPGEAIEMWGAKYGGYAVSASTKYPALAVRFAEYCVEADAKTFGRDMQFPIAFDLGETYQISALAAAQKTRVDGAAYRLPNITEWLMDAQTQRNYYALINRLMTGTMNGADFAGEFSAVWQKWQHTPTPDALPPTLPETAK